MKVIYIMGAGHIGSTILDILLGNHPNIAGVGEVSKLHRSGWMCHGKRRCACGLSVTECPYWLEVRRNWADIVGGDEVARHVYLQSLFERSRSGWPRLVRNSFAPSDRFIEYIHHVEGLYQSIQNAAGTTAVVDSSLTPRRAYALTLSRNIDLRLIHLVRDGRGCIWSLMKPGKRLVTREYIPAPAWRTTRYWLSANLQSACVFSRVRADKRCVIRYEDLVTDPSMTLKRIGRVVGEDLSCIINAVSTEQPIGAGHTVGGCRVRMSRDIQLRADFTWIDQLPKKERWLFWCMAGWLARLYGYARQPPDYRTSTSQP